MNEIKLVQPERALSEEQREPATPQTEIRVLEGFELMLAGGGDGEVSWP